MKVPLFVTCSAAFLAAWLGVTFFREVPQDAYPQLGKSSLAISAKMEREEMMERERMEKTAPLISSEEKAEEVVVTAE